MGVNKYSPVLFYFLFNTSYYPTVMVSNESIVKKRRQHLETVLWIIHA